MTNILFALLLSASDPPTAESASETPSSAPAAPAAPMADALRNQTLVTFTTGALFGVASTAAFTAGLDVERELRAGGLDRTASDDLLVRRSAYAWIAWPTAAISAAALSVGTYFLFEQGAAQTEAAR